MKIEAMQENKIVVELTATDMTELDITYDEMDYGNIETRRVIWTILDRARHTLQRDIDPSEKMLIETMPTVDGGCMICFTVLDHAVRTAHFHPAFRLHKEPTSLVYAFSNLSDLVGCAARLRASGRKLPKSSLFFLDGEYRLHLQSALPLRFFKTLLNEYGTACPESPFALSFLREHGKLLCEGNAIENLTIGL